MATEQQKKRQHERGFTLAMTLMLTVVLSLAAVAIMSKIFTSTRQSGFNKERQNTMDSAVIGLNLAIDEISPGMDRMRNAVWTSAVTPIPPTDPTLNYPLAARTQTQLKSDGASADTPVRELSLAGNIRNWEPFANWGGTTTAEWNRGWEYVASSSALQYFDAAPGQTGKATVSVGSQNLTGAYWYKQLDPKPPTLADGAPDVPVRSNGTKLWPNTRGGIYGNEYPYGLFCQPVLRKVYQVRQNPIVRVAVYVRMSLQDYYGIETRNGQIVYANRHMDGRTIPIQNPGPGMDTASASYDGRNFLETNAITFSVFAVSEGTSEAKGVRIHQALNVTLGGAEYISGRSARVMSSGRDINLDGLENPDRRFTPGGSPAFQHYMSPYFSPALDTPSGNSQLTAFAPVTGQVYPASGDLTLNFTTRPATEQVVFMYEHIKLANPADAQVVFLIEQIPPGVNGQNRYWRRRLLYDYPFGYGDPLWNDGVTGNNRDYPMMFKVASYTIDPWTDSSGFPSTLRWANVDPADYNLKHSVTQANKQEHFYFLDAGTMFGATGLRYPYSARLDRFGTFNVGTQSAGDFGVPAGDARGDIVTWPGNPLVDYKGNRLAASMPWQGPTVPYSQAVASVSYITTTWPKNAWSTIWSGNGGGIGIPFTAATWSVY